MKMILCVWSGEQKGKNYPVTKRGYSKNGENDANDNLQNDTVEHISKMV